MLKPAVNLNSIGQKELEDLPGIGKELARTIILHRQVKGGFVNPNELIDLIGEKRFEELIGSYNLYAISNDVWRTGLTNREYQLKPKRLEIILQEGGGSVLVSLPDKKWILIDCGTVSGAGNLLGFIKDRVIGDQMLCRLWHWLGVKIRFSYLFLTALSEKRIGGLDMVLKSIRFDNLVSSFNLEDLRRDKSAFRQMAESIVTGHYRMMLAGETITAGQVKIESLFPPDSNYILEDEMCPMVLKITYGRTSFIYLSEATPRQQSEILKNLDPSVLSAHVLISSGQAVVPDLMDTVAPGSVVTEGKKQILLTDGSLIHIKVPENK